MSEHNDPQRMYYPGHYGVVTAPQTQLNSQLAVIWDRPVKPIPAQYVGNLLKDGFRLALTVAEAAEKYDVPQYVIKALVEAGDLATTEDKDGSELVVYDIKARKTAKAEAERLRNIRNDDTKEEE